MGDFRIARLQGSSPLARGLQGDDSASAFPGGIIPARAGFTPWPHRPVPPHGDHPRSRGVYGSHSVFAAGLIWIIPARAGFTGRVAHRSTSRGDHPRSRGVYSGEYTVISGHAGSSPLARGLQFRVPDKPIPGRIIPARAGFTDVGESRGQSHWDHPRSRGVYGRTRPHGIPAIGSSPLARGLRVEAPYGQEESGIIPARAGFTRRRRR